MDFLDWVRGPLLAIAIGIFVAGVGWRLVSLWRLPAAAPPGVERHPFGRGAALRAAFHRFVPPSNFHPSATLATVNPYVFHVGLALVFFGYAPHIAFIHRLTGLAWPALPDWLVYLAAAATIISLLMALFRLTDPVLRRISGADDIITWAVTMLPLLTGMAVLGDPSAAILARDHPVYRGPLAVHLLSLELLLVWFPFGKLMHAFLVLPARMQLATFFGRRGVQS
jgi:nitrate reductase gamma subunit